MKWPQQGFQGLYPLELFKQLLGSGSKGNDVLENTRLTGLRGFEGLIASKGALRASGSLVGPKVPQAASKWLK